MLRVMFNRDERLGRTPARAPELIEARDRRAVMPIDPESGGTWIAVTDAGLVFAVLNQYPANNGNGNNPDAVRDRRVSRGCIIPLLVASESPRSALARAAALDLGRFAPFRLVCLDASHALEVRWNGRALHTTFRPLTAARLWTSCSADSQRAMTWRTCLFRARLGRGHLTAARQEAFHRHQWPTRPQLSVRMERPDARTVSIITVEATRKSLGMTYEALVPPDRPLRTSLA
jgi:hypothetical protein